MLYLTPGLLATQVVQIIYTAVVLSGLRSLLLGNELSPVKFGIYVVIEIVSVAVICPLDVMTMKLAIQRNHADAEYNSVAQEVEDDAIDAPEYAQYSGQEEDVIG